MEPNEAKLQIEKILGTQIRYEGHFNKIIATMDDNIINALLQWTKDCKEDRAYFKQSKKISGLLIFIFRPNDTRYRAILTKKRNEYFLSFFLDKHKYYERELQELGM